MRAKPGWGQGGDGRVIGVLDIGSSKIACLVAVADRSEGSGHRVLGAAHYRSQGVKSGVITDLHLAEQAARAAIARAERMAGTTLDAVVVSVACGRLQSHNFAAQTEVEGGIVTEQDTRRISAGGQAFAERDGRTLVHLNQICSRLDGAPGASDPRGMAARRLEADLHAVTVDEAPLRNLLLVVERCYLTAAALVPAPLASAIGVTTEEERNVGVTCIDVGGGTTTLAMFADGKLIHVNAAAMGGNHITLDIACVLHTPLADAERIKALYGSLISAQSDEHDVVTFPLAGEDRDATGHTSKAALAEVVRSRVESQFAHIGEQIERSGMAAFASGRIVLTGGGSQLVGMAEFAAAKLGRPVRVAAPGQRPGLPTGMAGPGFAVVAGLLGEGAAKGTFAVPRLAAEERGYLKRVGSWLREGF